MRHRLTGNVAESVSRPREWLMFMNDVVNLKLRYGRRVLEKKKYKEKQNFLTIFIIIQHNIYLWTVLIVGFLGEKMNKCMQKMVSEVV